jgi:hypothetical protein
MPVFEEPSSFISTHSYCPIVAIIKKVFSAGHHLRYKEEIKQAGAEQCRAQA